MDASSELPFEELDAALAEGGTSNLLEQLANTLEGRKQYPLLLEARLIAKRHELGLPLVGEVDQKTLSDESRKAIESNYRETCRELGRKLIEERDFAAASTFYGAIGETEALEIAVAAWRESPPEDIEAELDSILDLTLRQGISPVTGFELLLEHRGVCDAISILEDRFPYGADVRIPCVKALVYALYRELRRSLDQDLIEHEGAAISDGTVIEILNGRRWLFRGNRCHVDDSHLQAVLRFSIALEDPIDLGRAVELAVYGMHLPSGFQHSELSPFDDFYNDYRMLLEPLVGTRVEEGLQHFDQKLKASAEQNGQALQFPAEVAVFIHYRAGDVEGAIEIFLEHLTRAPRLTLCPPLFDLCVRLGNFDALMRAARENQNPLQYAVGLIHQSDRDDQGR